MGRYKNSGQDRPKRPKEWGQCSEEDIAAGNVVFIGHDAKPAMYILKDEPAPGRHAANGTTLLQYLTAPGRGWYECDDSHVPKAIAPAGGAKAIKKKVKDEAPKDDEKRGPGRPRMTKTRQKIAEENK